jgi:sorbitol-specific phosphotransferase system component IIA
VIGKGMRFSGAKKATFRGNDEIGGGYKNLAYVRYADEFLIGVAGNLEDCRLIKKDITEFLKNKLELVLPGEPMLITHRKNPARFLSFEIATCKSGRQTKKNAEGNKAEVFDEKIAIRLAGSTVKKKLLDYGVLQIIHHNGKEQWKPKHRKDLIFKDDIAILSNYNDELIGFYNYYSIAFNSAALRHLSYIMEYSMYKTFAAKYRTTVSAICRKYQKNGVFTVFDSIKNSEIRFNAFNNGEVERIIR